MRTDAEIRTSGVQVLLERLGTVETERFITLLLREPFDYTAWQKQLWPGQSVEAISQAAMRSRLNQSPNRRPRRTAAQRVGR